MPYEDNNDSINRKRKLDTINDISDPDEKHEKLRCFINYEKSLNRHRGECMTLHEAKQSMIEHELGDNNVIPCFAFSSMSTEQHKSNSNTKDPLFDARQKFHSNKPK